MLAQVLKMLLLLPLHLLLLLLLLLLPLLLRLRLVRATNRARDTSIMVTVMDTVVVSETDRTRTTRLSLILLETLKSFPRNLSSLRLMKSLGKSSITDPHRSLTTFRRLPRKELKGSTTRVPMSAAEKSESSTWRLSVKLLLTEDADVDEVVVVEAVAVAEEVVETLTINEPRVMIV